MLDFIINPIAGDKTGKKMKNKLVVIENYLKSKNADYRFHFTERFKHATEITKTLIENGAEKIIVAGGDGTLHDVINGFSDFDKTVLGLLPCGTGNDFAAAIGMPNDVEKALDVILTAEPKFTDFMQMPSVRGINIIGAGIDVDVLKRYNALKKKTKIGYAKCLFKTLHDFKYTDFYVNVNGEEKKYTSFIVCIANGFRYGGGIAICPPAVAFDNQLDFLTVKKMNKLKLIASFNKLKAGKVLSFPETEHTVMQSVSIKTDYPITVNVDGELYDGIPFNVEIVKNTLRMLRP
ncbi:MAG: diacylglycerol kinase family lipid kinase [Clostridia bacterium]|nr:diacylglycerol kinase family lipid kinase [Clostridia bacterium]